MRQQIQTDDRNFLTECETELENARERYREALADLADAQERRWVPRALLDRKQRAVDAAAADVKLAESAYAAALGAARDEAARQKRIASAGKAHGELTRAGAPVRQAVAELMKRLPALEEAASRVDATYIRTTAHGFAHLADYVPGVTRVVPTKTLRELRETLERFEALLGEAGIS